MLQLEYFYLYVKPCQSIC